MQVDKWADESLSAQPCDQCRCFGWEHLESAIASTSSILKPKIPKSPILLFYTKQDLLAPTDLNIT